MAAARIALVSGLGKPLVNIAIAVRLSMRNLKLKVIALRDGIAGRMGSTIRIQDRRLRRRTLETP